MAADEPTTVCGGADSRLAGEWLIWFNYKPEQIRGIDFITILPEFSLSRLRSADSSRKKKKGGGGIKAIAMAAAAIDFGTLPSIFRDY